MIITRQITRAGKNMILINGCHVTLSVLRSLGEYLVDIHGQNENLALLRADHQFYLLDHYAALSIGRFYSEEEFSLHGLAHLQGPVLEIGRTCVDPAYRNGGTIAVLWGELAEVLNQGDYHYLMGCASIPMHDGGIQAHAIMQRLRERYLCNEHLRAEPKKPLPALDLPSNVIAEMPPLLKAYMRLGAKICGEPCWDEDFQVADVFILLKRDELCPRYARHFKAAM